MFVLGLIDKKKIITIGQGPPKSTKTVGPLVIAPLNHHPCCHCFMPPIFGKVKYCSLHYFSNTCKKGYGQVTYLHLVDESGKVCCTLAMGKARVAPRMELVAVTLSVKI